MNPGNTLRRNLAVLLGAILLAFSGLAGATIIATTAHYVPGEVLVKFKSTVATQGRHATVATMGNILRTDLKHNWIRVALGPGQTVAQMVAAYKKDPNVEYAQPNFIYHATSVPNDPQYGNLWAFKNNGQTLNSVTQGEGWIFPTDNPGTPGDDMDVEPAWSHITDCSTVVIAVIDTGVNYNQEDLAANMWNGSGVNYNGSSITNHGYNFVDNNNDPMDLNGHGTHVAGIIGAVGNNGIGTTGVCWKANIMAVRVLDTTGSGTTANIIQGIDFAVANGAKVINMSLGGTGAFDQLFSDAITNAQNNDSVVVVAAGNDEVDNDISGNAHYPCDFTQSNLVCVAALDQKFALANFSDWGATSVAVGAPGTNILSTYAGANTVIQDSFTSGWSMSTTTGSGWRASSSNGVPLLLDPSNWPYGTYALNTDDRAYKVFTLGASNAAILNASLYANVLSDGGIAIADSTSGGDPFAPPSPAYLWGPYYTDSTPTAPLASDIPISISADISNCISASCTIGIRMLTGSTADYGAAFYDFSIETLALDTTSYNTLNGTSMATPEVAGLAAMLRAYNPKDSYADIVNAIKQGGRSVASLAGKTSTGNAIDVMKSLSFINAPTGLSATVH
ncbi:MAG: S8 family peptidase [Acidiferrobacterales bacterium]